MPALESIRKLILNSKLREAAKELDKALGRAKEEPELWYLRGVCSLKLNNYDYAQECFDYALSFDQKAEYGN
ncbi:tetratricopeptide repeat protein [Candidatus Micrarchaeota archaeon]|nr:tetratricopeptide repeat protein [Candidatus Micrarchaeota archaeon]